MADKTKKEVESFDRIIWRAPILQELQKGALYCYISLECPKAYSCIGSLFKRFNLVCVHVGVYIYIMHIHVYMRSWTQGHKLTSRETGKTVCVCGLQDEKPSVSLQPGG